MLHAKAKLKWFLEGKVTLNLNIVRMEYQAICSRPLVGRSYLFVLQWLSEDKEGLGGSGRDHAWQVGTSRLISGTAGSHSTLGGGPGGSQALSTPKLPTPQVIFFFFYNT